MLPGSINHWHPQLNLFKDAKYLRLRIPSCFHDFPPVFILQESRISCEPIFGGQANIREYCELVRHNPNICREIDA